MNMNENSTVKRWVIILGIALIMILVIFLIGSGTDAHAGMGPVTVEQPTANSEVADYSVKIVIPMVPVTTTRSTQNCWGWGFGPWESRDGFDRLRFGYGESVIACTNLANTRWVSVPQFDPYYYIGYWAHDKTSKSRSALGYSFLSTSTLWKFSWDPVGIGPTWHKDRTLRCNYEATNHTATCTLYY